jgi:hypothetical protein
MIQVVETIKGLELNPVMTTATKGFFNRSLSFRIKGGLEDDKKDKW